MNDLISASAAGRGAIERILLVEDEPDIQMVAKMALEAMGGFTVEACSRGSEALEKAPGFRPDVILMDVMMPGMDGMETSQRLREIEELADVPIIFMTAKIQPHEVLGYTRLGAIGVIEKPFDPVELAVRVRSLWEAGQVEDGA